MTKPRLLDLFSGAGGAARGYQLAGFHVTGVDNRPQPHYCGDAFVQADALEYVAEHGREFDAIHASPPCQAYSALKVKTTKVWPQLIEPTRDALIASGRPWIIENVMPAPLGGIVLCAAEFGLRTHRHRRFETSWLILQPSPLHTQKYPRTSTKKRHTDLAAGMFVSVTGDVGSYVGPPCMGIDWMTGDELSEAIPPAYTEWIGAQLIAALEHVA